MPCFLKKNARFKNIINKLEYLSFGLMASRWPWVPGQVGWTPRASGLPQGEQHVPRRLMVRVRVDTELRGWNKHKISIKLSKLKNSDKSITDF